MGLLSKGMKTGLARTSIDQARKPGSQRKIKDLFSSLTGSKKSGGSRKASRPR